MTNPFRYGGVVSDDSFCNRKKEVREIVRMMENSGRAFLYSERRFGKTSLVQLALMKLTKKEYLSVYIDVWPTDGELSFVTTVAKAITKSLSTGPEKALKRAKELFNRLTPSMTLDEDGKPVVTFGLGKHSSLDPELEEVLSAPARVAAQSKKKVVVVFDEIQRILEYDSDLVERKLRSIIQHQKYVSYIFLGSRKHLIEKMFLDKSRPLYRSATHLTLPAIGQEEWLPFVRKRFEDSQKKISDNQIRTLCELTQGHPFYTQQLCHVLWELCDRKKNVTDELVKEAIHTVFVRESYAYSPLWDSLTTNQQRFLVGLTDEHNRMKPFSATFLRRYRLGTASSAQRVVDTLLERDIIDHEGRSFIILDRFFRMWIQKVQIEKQDFS